MAEDDTTCAAEEATDENDAPKKKSTPGCFIIAALLAAAALAGGIYLMTQWNALSGGGRAGAVVLVVIGTMFALPIVVIGGIYVGLRIFIGRVTKDITDAGVSVRQAGKTIFGDTKAMFDSIHEYRAANDGDFAKLDRAFYDTGRDQLQGMGWRHLGDIVNATLEQLKDVTTVIRVRNKFDDAAHRHPQPQASAGHAHRAVDRAARGREAEAAGRQGRGGAHRGGVDDGRRDRIGEAAAGRAQRVSQGHRLRRSGGGQADRQNG